MAEIFSLRNQCKNVWVVNIFGHVGQFDGSIKQLRAPYESRLYEVKERIVPAIEQLLGLRMAQSATLEGHHLGLNPRDACMLFLEAAIRPEAFAFSIDPGVVFFHNVPFRIPRATVVIATIMVYHNSRSVSEQMRRHTSPYP